MGILKRNLFSHQSRHDSFGAWIANIKFRKVSCTEKRIMCKIFPLVLIICVSHIFARPKKPVEDKGTTDLMAM